MSAVFAHPQSSYPHPPFLNSDTISLFDQVEELMVKIEAAFTASDYVRLRAECHSLKGSSKYMAATRLALATEKAQLLCERDVADRSGVPAAIAEVREAAAEVYAYLASSV